MAKPVAPPYKLLEMRYLLLLLIPLLWGASCGNHAEEDFKKTCPYELHYPGHFLRVPVSISPHKLQYHVGDTMKISTIFSDSIYDLGTQHTFKIEGFPFKPTSLLYRFTASDTYDSGYTVNELTIDSVYTPYYWYSNSYADGFNAKTLYEDSTYRFECQLVLKEAGRYVLLFTDLYQDYVATGNSDLNAEADAITFEGKCPTLSYYICSMIDSGDAHLDLFKDELVFLDQEVYNGAIGSAKGSIEWLGRGGGFAIDFSGGFCFEVVE